jgi:hypothetical protein
MKSVAVADKTFLPSALKQHEIIRTRLLFKFDFALDTGFLGNVQTVSRI